MVSETVKFSVSALCDFIAVGVVCAKNVSGVKFGL